MNGLSTWYYVDLLPGGPVVEDLPANARDTDLIPGWGRSHIPWDN